MIVVAGVAGVAIVVAAVVIVIIAAVAVINVVIKYLQLPPHKACQLWVQWCRGAPGGSNRDRDVKVQKFSTNFLSLLCSLFCLVSSHFALNFLVHRKTNESERQL